MWNLAKDGKHYRAMTKVLNHHFSPYQGGAHYGKGVIASPLGMAMQMRDMQIFAHIFMNIANMRRLVHGHP